MLLDDGRSQLLAMATLSLQFVFLLKRRLLFLEIVRIGDIFPSGQSLIVVRGLARQWRRCLKFFDFMDRAVKLPRSFSEFSFSAGELVLIFAVQAIGIML